LRHGTQRFRAEPARGLSLLLLLAVAVVIVPTLAAGLALPAAHHERALSDVAAVTLLAVYVLGTVGGLGGRHDEEGVPAGRGPRGEALPPALVVLVGASVAAAFVSAWFVDAFQPAITALGISETFAGLVIVAIAGNAVENVVGVRLAGRNQTDLSLSVVLQSPLQIALVLIPVLVLVSPILGGSLLTLVFPPLLVASLGLAAVVTAVVVMDGESTWMEGTALVGLYAVIAAAFWWG
ncbi:MAG TPA: hypothetical protein VE152_07750, partial [Acidimicrobiales bacterium]|nr:hypothetical protein [Acidimicrobiales bacterium]